ncbi:MAG: spore germination protein [Firmicutes bacterium]|nr:spore germination protein [Bacillota bacterium]
MGKLTKKLQDNLDYLKEKMGVGQSFDVIVREMEIAGKDAALIFVDGFVKDEVMFIMKYLFQLQREDIVPQTIDKLYKKCVVYFEVDRVDKSSEIIDNVLAGPVALLVDGEREAIIIDAREYPARGPEEPDIERVTRGSRDGFTETLVFNTALIRRRIRDPALRVELIQVGQRSKTDIALVYIKDIANPGTVDLLRERIGEIEIDGLPMAEKSVEEFLTLGTWNPFPQVRYTERPDVAAVHLLEGHILILTDTSPSALIAPATFFHHIQHAEEFRQNAAVGAYMRWVRYFGILLSLIITPLWLLLVLKPGILPPGWNFIGPKEPTPVPILLQLLLAEVGVDLVRMAAIHTPSALATALGIIAAFMIGEIAISVGLFTGEVVLYMAIAAVGTFATPGFEFAFAIRLIRLFLLLAVALFHLPGLLIGLVLFLFLLLRTKSFNVPYLWPLFPLDAGALLDIFIRWPIPYKVTRPSILRPRDPDRLPAPGGENDG